MPAPSPTLRSVVEANPNVLSDPEPVYHLNECGNSSLNFVVRLWCANENYWDLYFYMLEEGKRALDKAGIEIPYPFS